ncbi:MAG: hypothetical protein CL960_05740 [Euryarchaeota archaeon]|jgi:chitodextrinase|nr:hypothetical protein [Euryarchaeota archaeon]|tara:strand:+ start:9176 stop:10285 length:1110 start_codon:yes stop_codon:yes gene_type:complete
MVAHNPLTPCGCARVRPALLLAALLLAAGCLDAGPGTLEDVEIMVPEGVIEGDPAQFSLLGPQPSGTKYYWEFGDGNGIVGAAPAHTYAGEGTYAVRLTAVAPDGATGAASASVEILHRNLPPTADAGPGLAARVHEQLRFDGSNSSDPEGVLAWAWDFGDGALGSGARPFHNYSAPGNYSVTLVVTDAEGLNATASTWAEVRLRNYSIGFTETTRTVNVPGYTAEGDMTEWLETLPYNVTSVTLRLEWSEDEAADALGLFPDDFELRGNSAWGARETARSTSGDLSVNFTVLDSIPAAREIEGESGADVYAQLLAGGDFSAKGRGDWTLAVTCHNAPSVGLILDLDGGNDWVLTLQYSYYFATVVELT